MTRNPIEISDPHAGVLGAASENPELLRQCIASGQVAARQIVQHGTVAPPAPVSRTARAFHIADTAMYELLVSEGVPYDSPATDATAFGLTDEACQEVTRLAETSPALREAFEWLKARGYVELASDDAGEFITVLRRPGECTDAAAAPASARWWHCKHCRCDAPTENVNLVPTHKTCGREVAPAAGMQGSDRVDPTACPECVGSGTDLDGGSGRPCAKCDGTGDAGGPAPCPNCAGWKLLAESALAAAESGERIEAIRAKYGLGTPGVDLPDGAQR